jgi:hypothetical protein
VPRGRAAGTFLIVSLSDFVYQLKLEGVLGKALELAGYRPIVLTFQSNRWAEPYFRSVGIDDFVYAERMLEEATGPEVERAASDALSGDVSVQSLKTLRFHGASVGQQTISSLSRGFERGRISLADEDVRAALPGLLRNAMRSVLAGERLLDRIRPEIVLFNEKGYAGFGSIYDVALERGANVIQFVAAGIHWRDALVFKRFTEETRRVYPHSLSAESWDHVRRLPWTEQRECELQEEFRLRYDSGEKHPDAGLQEGKQIKRPEEVAAQLGLETEKKTAVIFSHVLWDANLFYGDDLFEDQETWLVETVRAACANPNVNWVVKLHPANMYKSTGGEPNDKAAIHEAVGVLPPHVKLLEPDTDINTYSLFGLADYGITIRGTIGLELPCFGVPVLTAGTGRYSGLGFTADSDKADQYLEKLARIELVPPLTEDEVLLAKRHAHALFRLRPFHFTSMRARFMPAGRLKHPLSHNLDWTLQTPCEVESAPDLRAFADWAVDRSRLDWLNPLDA